LLQEVVEKVPALEGLTVKAMLPSTFALAAEAVAVQVVACPTYTVEGVQESAVVVATLSVNVCCA
jgi:hypothetical protein